jgi:hypothetical protein
MQNSVASPSTFCSFAHLPRSLSSLLFFSNIVIQDKKDGNGVVVVNCYSSVDKDLDYVLVVDLTIRQAVENTLSIMFLLAVEWPLLQ